MLGDLHLRDFVDLLADRLPNSRRSAGAHPNPHQEDSEEDRHDGRDHEVDNRLSDRQIQWAEVDRNPIVLLELLDGIELATRESCLRERECEDCNGQQPRSHRPPPK